MQLVFSESTLLCQLPLFPFQMVALRNGLLLIKSLVKTKVSRSLGGHGSLGVVVS